MKRLGLVLVWVAACAVPDLETDTTVQAGTSAQGTSAQGTSAQGTSAQGTSAQGTSAQGTTSGGLAVSEAHVVGTALQFWRMRSDGYWLQYTPNQLCVWLPSRAFKVSCTSYDLATQPSPLAGSQWPMNFTRVTENADGTTTKSIYHMKVQIGLSATHVGAVRYDTSTAMFDLRSSGATGAITSCDNPGGCRRNTDLLLYDVKVVDFDGSLGSLCPAGQSAIALAGTWDASATHHDSSTQFTFACTNGTIAKCTRWGYRPWASAVSDSAGSGARPVSLAGYHQACVHAALADYCGDGHSFTKNGTIIDISDDELIKSTRDLQSGRNAHYTATAFEGRFDQLGGFWLDQARYQEMQSTGDSIETECPGTFITGTFVDAYARPGVPTYPILYIESAPSCAHSEQTVGKWLDHGCSCTTTLDGCEEGCSGQVAKLLPYCTDPTDPRGWDQTCVQAAQSCTGSTMAAHSECTTGRGLEKYATGCTLALSLKGYTGCFDVTNPSAWSSTCVDAANTYCTGGQEHAGRLMNYGFCNSALTGTVGNSL